MANTQVLLREDIDDLGARGEIVRVKAGYARNYLLPRKLAVRATASNVKQIEQERAALLKKEAKERGSAELQAAGMGRVSLNFQRRVGEHGMLYGSVTSMDIAEALKERGYEIDRRRIRLPEAIKEVGEYSVQVRLHREVNVEIPVVVRAEGAAGGVQSGAPTVATAGTGEGASDEAVTAQTPAAQAPEEATAE